MALGCAIGRDEGEWIDIIFFGHQLTIHQERKGLAARPIDHFGPVLDKKEWLDIAGFLAANKVAFVVQPTIKAEGTSAESGKYIVKDPAGNSLEFKYYRNFPGTVG